MSGVQPPDELLEKIEEIASIKRELSRKQRAVTSAGGLYVWADKVPDGRTLVRAGPRSIFAKLIFYVHPDGQKEVKKYQPGEWEAKADFTLHLTRAVVRAANWTMPPSKQEAFFADETIDWDDPKWQEVVNAGERARAEHEPEIDSFQDSHDRETRLAVMEAFFGTLGNEWPLTFLEIIAIPKRAPGVLAVALDRIFICYGAGYGVGRGWLSPQHLDYMLIVLADNMVRTVRETYGLPQARRYPYVEAFRKVAELGIAASEESVGVSGEGNDKPAETAPEQGVSRPEAQGRRRLLEERWKAQLKEKKRRS